MKRIWSPEELNTHWVLSASDLALLKGKSEAGRLLVSVLLKHYQRYAFVPQSVLHVSDDVWDFVGGQLGLTWQGSLDFEGDSMGRTIRRYSEEIRSHLGIRRFDHNGRASFKAWLISTLFPKALEMAAREVEIQNWFCPIQIG